MASNPGASPDRWLWRSLGYWIVACVVLGPVATVLAVSTFVPELTLSRLGVVLGVLVGIAVGSLLASIGLVRLSAEHMAVLRTLLSVGASIRVLSSSSQTPLPEAARVFVAAVVKQRRAQASAWLLLTSFLHDLKAPIAGLRHLLDATIGERGSSGDARALHDARREVTSVQVLVHNALDFARFQRDDMALTVGTVQVRNVVDEVVRRVGWAAQGSAVEVDVEGDWVAEGDARLIGRVCENLLLNGVLHARSRVRVAISPGLIVIDDDGPGLPQSVLAALDEFNSSREVPFSRVPDSTGHGIGFLAANAMLRTIGGKLVVQSTSSTGTVLLAYLRSPA